MPQWIRDTVLAKAIALAYAANMPIGFIEGLQIVETATGFQLYNDWAGEFGEPLAKWFEDGTRTHWIEPKVKHPPGGNVQGRSTEKAEHGDGTTVQHPSVLHWTKNGVSFFSKGHYVRGIPKFAVMKNALESGGQELAIKIREYQESTA